MEYIETIIPLIKNLTYLYDIMEQKLLLKIMYVNINLGWNLDSLNKITSLNTSGGVCNISLIWHWTTEFQFFCFNTSASDNIS